MQQFFHPLYDITILPPLISKENKVHQHFVSSKRLCAFCQSSNTDIGSPAVKGAVQVMRLASTLLYCYV